jgi:hypothetical protein
VDSQKNHGNQIAKLNHAIAPMHTMSVAIMVSQTEKKHDTLVTPLAVASVVPLIFTAP